MRLALAVLALAGCRQLLGLHDLDVDAAVADGDRIDAPTDGSGACWTFTPTNFDPCTLPPAQPATFGPNDTFDVDSSLSVQHVSQPGGPDIGVLHLSSLSITGTLRISGSLPLVLAIDGDFDLAPSAQILVASGADDDCPSGATPGTDSQGVGGGGGGGGGGGASSGAPGGNGNGTGHGSHGDGGNGFGNANHLSPLRGGCSGGGGGAATGGAQAAAGIGAGGLQLDAQGTIVIEGKIIAAGGGGGGGKSNQQAGGGGGGGGGGGAVFLEGMIVDVVTTGTLCADGGGGGQGASDIDDGGPGQTSACLGNVGGLGGSINDAGGAGGDGAYRNGGPQPPNSQALNADGGGGGGGATGWIQINGVSTHNVDPVAVVTPQPNFN